MDLSVKKHRFTIILIILFTSLATGCRSNPPVSIKTEIPSPTPESSINLDPTPTIQQQLAIPLAETEIQSPEEILPTSTIISSSTPTFAPSPTETSTPTLDPGRPILDAFIETIKTGNPDEVVGVHVEGLMMLKVIQQPPGDYSYVTDFDNEATEFILAYEVAGNLGLIAHNYLSGELFFNLQAGDLVEIIYGDGSINEYIVIELLEYQAVNPYSTTSDFISLDTNEKISATNLFYRVYGGENHHLTFQTCIEQNGNPVWGRFFAVSPEL